MLSQPNKSKQHLKKVLFLKKDLLHSETYVRRLDKLIKFTNDPVGEVPMDLSTKRHKDMPPFERLET